MSTVANRFRAEARELSTEEHEDRRELCEQLDSRIKAGMRSSRKALWQTAEALYEFGEQRGFEPLGFKTLREYLAQPEIDLSETTFHRLVGAWKTIVINRGVQPHEIAALDVTKVSVVLPAIKSATGPLATIFEDVRQLTVDDLRRKYSTPAAPPKLSVVDPPLDPEPPEDPPEEPTPPELNLLPRRTTPPDLPPETPEPPVAAVVISPAKSPTRPHNKGERVLTALTEATGLILGAVETLETAEASEIHHPLLSKLEDRLYGSYRELQRQVERLAPSTE